MKYVQLTFKKPVEIRNGGICDPRKLQNASYGKVIDCDCGSIFKALHKLEAKGLDVSEIVKAELMED